MIIGIQRGEFGLPITASDQPDLADIARFYRAGGGEFWVAGHGGSVVGTIAALKIGEDVAALRKMFVAREHRGASGLAASLMQTARRLGRGTGHPDDLSRHHRSDGHRAPLLRETRIRVHRPTGAARQFPEDGGRHALLPQTPQQGHRS